jgi:hypothetical protein
MIMVLGDGDFGRWWSHERRALINGISTLIKETLESRHEDTIWIKKGALARQWICQHFKKLGFM